MPDVDQYSFSYKELAQALVKQAGLHSGKWQIVVHFAFGAANAGPEPGNIVPTAFIGITKVGLIAAKPDSPDELTVDAAVVNPAPKKSEASGSSTGRRRRA